MMRALLDTNIVIHREAPCVVKENIGVVFAWLDRLGYTKCLHPATVQEIEAHDDPKVRRAFRTKIASYHVLAAPAALSPDIQSLSDQLDATTNERNDTLILNQLYTDRVDLLISEDRGIARKAALLGISDRVFAVDAFLEKVSAENPEFTDYSVLSIRRVLFGQVDVRNQFFDSLKGDYPGFDRWFNRKSEEPCYICCEGGQIVAFLYVKVEDEREPYSDIVPAFKPKKRLKIGTLKVELNGYKIGERFLKIVFDNALKQRVNEVYVTMFPNTLEEARLINLLGDFGFAQHGEKRNDYGTERVYVRDMTPRFNASDPKTTFPFISGTATSCLAPIYPEYHTELFPDSILRTESPQDFIEHEPHRNAIRKVYISRSLFRDLRRGDTIIFYRTGGYHKSVVTTVGIVEEVHLNIQDEEQFIRLCRKRSVFTDDRLRARWRYRPDRPFVVQFLYAYSFPRRPNLAELIEARVIDDVHSAPRGFERISDAKLRTILRLSETDPGLVVY